MFASQTRDLSHIELTRSYNISSLNAAKSISSGQSPHIDRKKQEQELKVHPFILAFFVYYQMIISPFVP